MTKLFNKSNQKGRRRDLRNRPTAAEVKLWNLLKSDQIQAKFRRQYGIKNFIVDFCSPRLKLIIEVDGDSHFLPGVAVKDLDRQKQIESLGFRMLRFTDNDIFDSPESVFDQIDQAIRATSPNPSLARRGISNSNSDSPPYQGGVGGGGSLASTSPNPSFVRRGISNSNSDSPPYQGGVGGGGSRNPPPLTPPW